MALLGEAEPPQDITCSLRGELVDPCRDREDLLHGIQGSVDLDGKLVDRAWRDPAQPGLDFRCKSTVPGAASRSGGVSYSGMSSCDGDTVAAPMAINLAERGPRLWPGHRSPNAVPEVVTTVFGVGGIRAPGARSAWSCRSRRTWVATTTRRAGCPPRPAGLTGTVLRPPHTETP